MIITPHTKLDCINEMLSTIGVAPIDTLENQEDIDVMNALHILDDVDQGIQMKGWTFNLFEDTQLIPDENEKKIKWDNHWLTILDKTYSKRGQYLYNMVSKTDIFESPITTTIIYHIDFEDLPTPFKKYITASACRTFAWRYLGDSQVYQAAMQDVMAAYQAIMEHEMELEQSSLSKNPSITQMLRR